MQTGNQQLSVSTSKGIYFFSPGEILRLEASSNYTHIYFTDKSKLVTAKVLKEFVQMLEPFGFVRTHRTHLVNRRHILCIAPNGNIIMKDASVAEISRRMKSEVMRALKTAAQKPAIFAFFREPCLFCKTLNNRFESTIP